METKVLFTQQHYRDGIRPTGLRDGTKLKYFDYFPGAVFCFVGVDDNGRAHSWRESGRKNGEKHSMWSDLVITQVDPNLKKRWIALSGEGKTYSAADRTSIAAVVEKWSHYSIWEVVFDLQTGKASGLKIDL